MVFFFPHSSNAKRDFKFEAYLTVKNLRYPDQELVEFDNILKYECKIRKENDFVEEIFFYFIWSFFRVDEVYLHISFG